MSISTHKARFPNTVGSGYVNEDASAASLILFERDQNVVWKAR